MVSPRVPSKSMFFAELFIAFMFTRTPYINVPFNWLETYFHELSHGIATLLTGGSVSHIELFMNGAGLCYSQGGWPVMIGFSGYLGASIWGYLMFNLATWPAGIRTSFAALGGLVVLTIVFWGRDILTVAILIALAVLFFLPLKLSHSRILTSSLRIAALMVLLNALSSPMVLLGMPGAGDAAMLSQTTWIPAWVWVAAWLLVALVLLFSCWRKVYQAYGNSNYT
ncbi:M50 family metallopeptidase [Shewanella gelidii]|nr:M50 family metallopeptidase [Shewanella gelidii]MCL1098633.1 M50 family metallopeptidase [Shewanella gelidii]